MSNEIHVKCLPDFFDALVKGIKRFEVRRDDRDYMVGDLFVFHKWDGYYTGEIYCIDITYIYRGEYCIPGYCILSLGYSRSSWHYMNGRENESNT